jgi:retron-type reverse transcriptase
MEYRLTREQLLADLRQAYYDARRHKRNKPYQVRFEAQLEQNLNSLCDELYSRTYRPLPSSCFIITDPKKREVFAADFRDRIVHHLYYNYTHEMYERTFVYDSYSCIKGRGTHFGIKRLEKHILQESQGYTVPCYVLKMDISGYFMHINRVRLLEICLNTLERMARHRVKLHCREVWAEVVDMDFVRYLTREIVLLNPMENCILRGRASDWDDLPYNKSLFNSPIGCGLPIGNLTSQLFSNVYLNVLDQYVKRELRCRHYGRYVDDFYVVSADKKYLSNVSMAIKQMLNEVLDLCINDGKTQVVSVWKGVEFLGAYVKPFRRYASRQTVARMREKLRCLQCVEPHKRQASLCSFRGVLSHGRNYKLECRLFLIFNS